MMDFHAVTLRQCCHPTSSPETSVKNYYSTLRNIPEERRSQAVFVPTIQKCVVKHFLLLAATLQQMAVVLCCCVNTVRHCATLRDTARHCATLCDTWRTFVQEPDWILSAPWRDTRTLPRRSLLPECHTGSRYTRKRNFIHTHKKGAAFPVAIFTKIAFK